MHEPATEVAVNLPETQICTASLRVYIFVQRSDIMISVSSESSHSLLIIIVKLCGKEVTKMFLYSI
jgi:hypothetical protein